MHKVGLVRAQSKSQTDLARHATRLEQLLANVAGEQASTLSILQVQNNLTAVIVLLLQVGKSKHVCPMAKRGHRTYTQASAATSAGPTKVCSLDLESICMLAVHIRRSSKIWQRLKGTRCAKGNVLLEEMSRQELAQHAARLEDLILQHADNLRHQNSSLAAESASNTTSDCNRCKYVACSWKSHAHQDFL